jgi:hypothetical protein
VHCAVSPQRNQDCIFGHGTTNLLLAGDSLYYQYLPLGRGIAYGVSISPIFEDIAWREAEF